MDIGITGKSGVCNRGALKTGVERRKLEYFILKLAYVLNPGLLLRSFAYRRGVCYSTILEHCVDRPKREHLILKQT